jgi:magnesium chelatase family protein
MSSNTVRAGISEARARQYQRGGMTNAVMHNRDVETTRKRAVQNHVLLDQAMTRFKLSARAYRRILKVARTIADLEGTEIIRNARLSEAISYQTLNRLLAG